MSSDKHCCVPGCKESGGSHPVLHGFPKPEHDKDRFNTWLYAIGSDILGLENEHIYKYRRVCRSHFAEQYLCRNNKLSKIAIPTLSMPGLTSSIKYTFVEQKPMRKVLSNLQPSTSTAPALPVFVEDAGEITGKENLDPTVPINEVPIVSKTPAVMKKVQPHLVSKKSPKLKFHFNQEEKLVHSQLVAAKRKIRKLHNKVKRQSAEIKAAKKLASNPAVLNILENCSSSAKLLMKIQLRENKKKEKGRRFTLQEKILSLCILKQSPKAYNFFRKFLFCLRSKHWQK